MLSHDPLLQGMYFHTFLAHIVRIQSGNAENHYVKGGKTNLGYWVHMKIILILT